MTMTSPSETLGSYNDFQANVPEATVNEYTKALIEHRRALANSAGVTEAELHFVPTKTQDDTPEETV